MGFKEVIKKIGEKNRKRKEIIESMSDHARFQKLVEDRMKSANERELERYMNEDREEMIKHKLEFARKKRDHDIKFNHNPLDAKNITNSVEWEVLKEKNQFTNNSNMFSGQESVLKNNNKLLKTNHKLLKGGNLFKI